MQNAAPATIRVSLKLVTRDFVSSDQPESISTMDVIASVSNCFLKIPTSKIKKILSRLERDIPSNSINDRQNKQ